MTPSMVKAIMVNTSPNTAINSTKTASIMEEVSIPPFVLGKSELPEAQTEPWYIAEAAKAKVDIRQAPRTVKPLLPSAGKVGIIDVSTSISTISP